MRDSRRSPLGATVFACALLTTALPASGGAVCEREPAASTTLPASDHARPGGWITELLGEKYISARSHRNVPHDEPLPEFQVGSAISNDVGGPRATVIPLPTPLWTGTMGLSALALAS